MKTILWALALASVICLGGCTERARQKGIFLGGDPALATQESVDDLRAEVKGLKAHIDSRFDRFEKR
jgi:hypothetical protein